MADEAQAAQAATEQAAQNQNRYGGPQRGGQRQGGNRPPRRDNRGPQAPEEKQFDERVVHIDRVARVVKGGRRFRFRALVVVGDRKGKVGIGSAKGADVTAAVTKATEVAKKHFVPVVLYKGTIPHDVEGKVSGARILVMPAAPGTGLIAGGVVRTVLEVAGVSNVLSKSLGSSNKTNIAYATIAALQCLEPSKNWVTTKHKKATEQPKKVVEVKPAPVKTESEVKKVVPAKKPTATKKAAPKEKKETK
ncbi:30S ribosomal protein S5 [Candidatus Saccharibacteria bacterium]|nr:MAG: 30S ribosomal protein S5 [Candidatus Saccharibacteria bacterium]